MQLPTHFVERGEYTRRKEKENFTGRCIFTVFFIGVMAICTLKDGGKRVDIIAVKDCMVDQAFVMTTGLNEYLRKNAIVRDWLIIFDSALFDIAVFGLLFLFKADKLRSVSAFLAFLISSLTKTQIGERMLAMGRLPGYNYEFPGFYSTVVPYHDIYDFYYSGHMATTAILIYFMHGLVK